MTKTAIPTDVQTQVEAIVAEFNRANFRKPERGYQARFRGRFLYLDRCDLDNPFQVCRLTYTGKMDKWDFAIYRHSKERYDPDEWMFPGDRWVDGTVQGAMKAGLEAYPVFQDTPQTRAIQAIFRRLLKG